MGAPVFRPARPRPHAARRLGLTAFWPSRRHEQSCGWPATGTVCTVSVAASLAQEVADDHRQANQAKSRESWPDTTSIGRPAKCEPTARCTVGDRSLSPTDENLEKLVEIFGQPIFSTFGAWVRETRAAKEWTQAQLAATAGLSAQTINFIEIGETQNPRDATRQRIEKALNANYEGQDNSQNEESSRGEDSIIGELIEFNPHDPGDWPDQDTPGIYMFYDGSGRLVRVGKSEKLGKRIGDHVEKFWFKEPVVVFGAYAPIRKDLVRRVEKLLLQVVGADQLMLNSNE